MRPTARGAASLLLLLGGLGAVTGCGEDDPFAAYCEEVQAQQKPLTEALAKGEATGLLAALPSFEILQEEAPDDIADDWAVITKRISELEQALDDAGIDPSTYDPEKPAEGLSAGDEAAISAAASQLASPAAVSALAGVAQQARDVCKTPLSL